MSAKYTEHGDEVEVLSEFDGGFVVQYFYEDDDQWGQQVHRYSEPMIVKQLFDAPPSIRRAADLLDLESQIKQKREELQTVTAEIKQAKATNKELLDVLAQNEALENLKDLIDGKVTHYVISSRYNGVRIERIDEFALDGDRKNRLLSLFGDSNNSLSWRINRYRDDNGEWFDCWPCRSLEEAQEIAKREIEKMYSDINRNSNCILDSAEAIGMKLPKRVELGCANYKLENANASYQRMLAEAEKTAKAVTVAKAWVEEVGRREEQ